MKKYPNKIATVLLLIFIAVTIYLISSILNWKFLLNIQSIFMIIIAIVFGILGGILGVNRK